MEEKLINPRPTVLADRPTHYCPGCHHGTAHKLVAQCLEEMNLVQDTICIGSIGCSVFIYNYILVDTVEAPHGRAPAVATGVKRARPDKFVFTYQGDGDLASIGLAEIMHCANRGERVSVVFVNNTVYGMTGGQMAPTTMVGQKTTTCPKGRSAEKEGMPIKMAEIIAGLGGTAYSARVAVNNIKNLTKAKKALKKAFTAQIQGVGFGFVEILAACPTNWKMSPIQANERIEKEMIPYFPLGEFKDRVSEAK
ncbi:2-oxoglutarate oxidoreductase [Desulfohalobiaceae bacterium Ax17]|jgi:2-oxoglutarate ferredoxin oxidoreductase subunit beta|uniref:thiamine pyrophosphate-dependent enzyme n=1 Tax=Desulfovulcanus ferrireducens TaxID=2831190 RepID=UPI00207BA54C|nr:thiamine pyrophosphate-dependent enzyme [Desulfovulcanus ferrireducens]MBT8763630.1 2-oxoglutarate oxidoreductase [Desulfovulcanus ferrireducens]